MTVFCNKDWFHTLLRSTQRIPARYPTQITVSAICSANQRVLSFRNISGMYTGHP